MVCREQRIDDKDFFGMLMATVGTDMIGSVNFKKVENGLRESQSRFTDR